MTGAAGIRVGYWHRLPRGYTPDHNVGLEWHVKNMGAHRTFPVSVLRFFCCVGIRRCRDHPAVGTRDSASVCCGCHMTIDTAGEVTFHGGTQLRLHMVIDIDRVTPLAQGRTGIILIVKEPAGIRGTPMQVMTVRAGDQQAIVPVHLRLYEIRILLVRFAGMNIVGPDIEILS